MSTLPSSMDPSSMLALQQLLAKTAPAAPPSLGSGITLLPPQSGAQPVQPQPVTLDGATGRPVPRLLSDPTSPSVQNGGISLVPSADHTQKPLARLFNTGIGIPGGQAPPMQPAQISPATQGAVARLDPSAASMPAPPTPSLGMGAPQMPSLSAPNAPQAAPSKLMTDQSDLARLQTQGPGWQQTQNPFLRALEGVGNGVVTLLAPRAAELIPGTTGHNLWLQGQDVAHIGQDQQQAQGSANLAQTQANTALLDAKPQIEQAQMELQQQRLDNQQQHNQDTRQSALARNGYAVDENDPSGQTIRPLRYDEMSEQQQGVYNLHQSQQAVAAAQAEYKKAMAANIPQQVELAKGRLAVAQQQVNANVQRLSLYGRSLDMRQQNIDANLYGQDLNGNALPGAPQIVNDAGGTQTVGFRTAGNAEKQQKTVATFNDLQGSVKNLRSAIQAYEAEGGDMSDARLAQAASDPTSVVGKVINGKLVTGGLSQNAITLLNAQRQTMEQAGILRSTTGGTNSEQGAQRILQTVPQFGSDTNNSAYSKLNEQETVLGRLAPGMTGVAGGLSVHGRSAPSSGGSTAGMVQVQIPGQQPGFIPRSAIQQFQRDHPNAAVTQ